MAWYGYYWNSTGKLETVTESGGNAPDGQTRVDFGESRPNFRNQMWDDVNHVLVDRQGGLSDEDIVITILADSRLNFLPPIYKAQVGTVLADYIEEGCRYR